MSRELETALSAVTEAGPEPAANDAAKKCHLDVFFSTIDIKNGEGLCYVSMRCADKDEDTQTCIAISKTVSLAVETTASQIAALQAECAELQADVTFWESRALSSQAALKALVNDPSFPDISDVGLNEARQALAPQPVEAKP